MSEVLLRGDVILCHDCNQIGYIVYDAGDYTLTPGWKMVWVGLKTLYICNDCGRKRVSQARELLNLK